MAESTAFIETLCANEDSCNYLARLHQADQEQAGSESKLNKLRFAAALQKPARTRETSVDAADPKLCNSIFELLSRQLGGHRGAAGLSLSRVADAFTEFKLTGILHDDALAYSFVLKAVGLPVSLYSRAEAECPISDLSLLRAVLQSYAARADQLLLHEQRQQPLDERGPFVCMLKEHTGFDERSTCTAP